MQIYNKFRLKTNNLLHFSPRHNHPKCTPIPRYFGAVFGEAEDSGALKLFKNCGKNLWAQKKALPLPDIVI